MSKKHAFVSALLFLGIVSNVGSYGACFYVSPDGDDQTGVGSTARPWKRINTALGKLQSGDTLYLTGGREFNQNVSIGRISVPAERVTITSDPANRARITGTGTNDGISVWNRAGVTIENLEIVGPGPANATEKGIGFMTDNGKHSYIRLSNVDVSGYDEGLAIYGWNSSTDSIHGFSDIIVDNCRFHHNLSAGGGTWADMIGGVSDIVVRNSTFNDNYGNPAETKNSGSGFVFGSTRSGIIEFCTAFNNGGDGVATEGPVGIWAYSSDSITIQFCESYGNKAQKMDGDGFDFDQNVTNSIIQYCYSHDNYGAGFLLCHGESGEWGNNTIRYCISENDGYGGKMGAFHYYSKGSGVKNSFVYNNTIYNEKSHAVWFHETRNMSGNYFQNNIIVTKSGEALVKGKCDSSRICIQGNCWWDLDGNPRFGALTSLEAWRDSTGHERLDGTDFGFYQNPRLTLPGQGGIIGDPHRFKKLEAYRIQQLSPCIDAGLEPMSISVSLTDFYGSIVPTAGSCDIGAHEFGGSTELVSPNLRPVHTSTSPALNQPFRIYTLNGRVGHLRAKDPAATQLLVRGRKRLMMVR